MKRIFCALALLFAGCDVSRPVPADPQPIVEPAMNLPAELRYQNWTSSQGEGSCAFAATANLLEWRNNPAMARDVREYYAGGIHVKPLDGRDLFDVLDKHGIRYAYSIGGDENFLRWCVRTRRGCAVGVNNYTGGGDGWPSHAITLVNLCDDYATLLGVNYPDRHVIVPRETFLRNWHAAGGCAWTVLDSPLPPLPAR